jgi:hypothetical protein
MSSSGLPTLSIDVAARRGERIVAAALVLSVPVAILPAGLPLYAAAVLAVALVLLLGAGFARLGWIGGRRRLTRIVCRPDGRWVLWEQGGRTLEAMLTSASRVSPHMLWLKWQPRRGPLLLFSTDLSSTDFRRLSVRLRLAGHREKEDDADV